MNEATEWLVDSVGPYVTRCGGMEVVGTLQGTLSEFPIEAADDDTSWKANGREFDDAEGPMDLVAKADDGALLRACVRNLLLLRKEADPSDERLAFLVDRMVRGYEHLLAEWDDLQEANDRRPGKSAAEFNADEAAERERAASVAGEATAGADEEEEPAATTADLITGPGRYPRRDGAVAPVGRRIHEGGPGRLFEWEGFEAESGIRRTWTALGQFDPLQGETTLDIVGPRIADDVSDEAAAAHARMVAEGVRRKQAETLPDDPEPVASKEPDVSDRPLQLEPGEWVCRNKTIVTVRRSGSHARDVGRYIKGAPFISEWGDDPRVNWDVHREDGSIATQPIGEESDGDIVRRHVPAPEATVPVEAPKLEEEIGEGAPPCDCDQPVTCTVRVVAVQAEFDGTDADLILPSIFDAIETALHDTAD